MRRGHESVIEHFSFSVKFICDRGFSHELVRHRLCAFTQESTRYCNYSNKDMTFIQQPFWGNKELQRSTITNRQERLWKAVLIEAENTYNALITNGATPQEARSVLPNSLKTEIVVTTNLREWRHILKQRTNKDAHPQLRQLMIPLLKELQIKLPAIFGDIVVEH